MEKNNHHNLIDCSFLEVTINSNKLMQIIEKIMKQVNQHNNEIKILRQVIPTIKSSVCSSMETTENRIKLQTQRNALKLKEEMNLIKAHFQSFDQELTKTNINMQKKFKQKEIDINFLIDQKKRIQSVINVYEQSRLGSQNKLREQIQSIKQSLTQVQKQIKDYDSKTDDKFQMMYLKIQSILKKGNSHHRHQGDMFDSSIKKQRKTNGTSTNASRVKDSKANSTTYYANWATFSSKISQMEKKAEDIQQNLPCVNKVMFSKKISSQQEQNQNGSKADLNDSYQYYNTRTDDINIMMSTFNSENVKNIQILKNKLVIQEEKLGINSRKIQKILQTQAQFKLQLKRSEDKKGDDHFVQVLRNQFKKMIIQLTEDVDRKLNKEVFQKQRAKNMEKISIIQENITQKADKGDMKKAFLFMQEKIKQLIILIASDQNQEKDGAIRKIPAKCLSCDKGLQTQKSTPARIPSPLTMRQKQPNIRTLTRKVRKRMQTSSQNNQNSLIQV